MRFLVDANLPRAIVATLRFHGHEAEHVKDIGLGSAPDERVAAHARGASMALITRDLDFADIRNYPPDEYPGLIVLRVPEDTVAGEIVRLIERFVTKPELVQQVPRHLVILEEAHVRFRPALQVGQ
jgi:predicted nuclease of predicted toxin-antitoxin system